MRYSAIFVLLVAAAGHAQSPLCRFYLVNHSDSVHGLSLSLETTPDSQGNCSLSSMRLRLTVGDGTALHHVESAFAWQIGTVYTARAVISGAGPQLLSVNGQALGSLQQSFAPASVALAASYEADLGTASKNYIANPLSIQVSNGTNSLNLSPNGGNPLPTALILLGSGPAIWNTAFAENAALPTTVTATFRFDSAVANPHQLDPYIDTYGQAIAATYPGKIQTDADLQSAALVEQTWLANHPPLGGLDPYGGSMVAGWTDKNTGYYHTASHNGRWYLISPLGNPLFYLGITAYGLHTTPITGREGMFQLPQKSGPLAAAYSLNVYNDPQDTTYFSHGLANQIRKYGSASSDVTDANFRRRLASWVFAGGGKFGSFPTAMPVTPLIGHNDAKTVPPAVPGGHQDVFDPSVLAKMKALYAKQIGSDIANPYVVGWAVGNEAEEEIAPEEVAAMLALGASSPAKKALVDRGLTIYSGSVSALAAAWQIAASTVGDVYASKPSPPARDIENLRQFFAQAYYAANYQIVKSIDPNHLFFGSWITAGDTLDWPIAAANCDVVGFDDFFPGALSDTLLALFASTQKPVMLGAFGVPSDYGGTRGFGWNQYTGAMTLSDSASGDEYTQRISSAVASPYVVGAMLFDYLDEPLTGRGDSTGANNLTGNLVVDEDYAFGLVDVTDTPKYDFVNPVRAANIAALQSLGLLGAAPTLASPAENGATYEIGGLVPGSWAQVKGSGLSDVTRAWSDTDFAGLGNTLPTSLSGVQVTVNGTPAAVYYVSPAQVNFQVPAGVSGTAAVEVIRDGLTSNSVSAQAAAVAPGIFPIFVADKVYPAAVFLDGKYAGDPASSPAFRNARAGDVVQLYGTGLAVSPAGTLPVAQTVTGVTVTIGTVTAPANFAGLVAVGEFQVNFTVPQQFASLPEGSYPISIAVNGVSSPGSVNGIAMTIPVRH